jgi:hypothetical protein
VISEYAACCDGVFECCNVRQLRAFIEQLLLPGHRDRQFTALAAVASEIRGRLIADAVSCAHIRRMAARRAPRAGDRAGQRV